MKSFCYIFVLLITTPSVLLAQISTPLLQFPQGGTTSFDSYINWLYVFSISIAALLAVVKIIIAGFKYVLSDVVSSKGQAKDDIKGALLGLLLILGAYIILNTINPNLVRGTISLDAVTSAPPPRVAAGGAIAAVPQTKIPPNAPPIEEFPTSGYGFVANQKLDPAYITKNGRVMTFRADDYCKAQYASEVSGCMSNVEALMFDPGLPNTGYCVNNAGRPGRTSTSYTCQLPAESRGPDYFESEYQRTKAPTDTTPFDQSIFTRLCQASGGTLVDIKTFAGTGVDDYRCVKY